MKTGFVPNLSTAWPPTQKPAILPINVKFANVTTRLSDMPMNSFSVKENIEGALAVKNVNRKT